jgi:hypothetical protein
MARERRATTTLLLLLLLLMLVTVFSSLSLNFENLYLAYSRASIYRVLIYRGSRFTAGFLGLTQPAAIYCGFCLARLATRGKYVTPSRLSHPHASKLRPAREMPTEL